ncbi:MAG TPA: MarR family winged helix-turn-helix transcriptional regulator [Actinomycetota bacterium]|nr:MarR family winged helix-turn-helix transcriptional regulator [Actinomycetota bacterium]
MYISLGEIPTASECLAAKVRRVHRVVVRHYDDNLRRLGITVAQLDMLETLLEHGGRARAVDMSRWLLMDRSTVARNIRRLEAAGLVTVQPGPSKREKEIVVTAQGESLAADAKGPWEHAQQTVGRLLGPEGIEALEVLVERVTSKGGT